MLNKRYVPAGFSCKSLKEFEKKYPDQEFDVLYDRSDRLKKIIIRINSFRKHVSPEFEKTFQEHFGDILYE